MPTKEEAIYALDWAEKGKLASEQMIQTAKGEGHMMSVISANNARSALTAIIDVLEQYIRGDAS